MEECLSDSGELGRACLVRKEILMEDTPWGYPDDRCQWHRKRGPEFQTELRRAVARVKELLESGEAGLEELLELRKPYSFNSGVSQRLFDRLGLGNLTFLRALEPEVLHRLGQAKVLRGIKELHLRLEKRDSNELEGFRKRPNLLAGMKSLIHARQLFLNMDIDILGQIAVDQSSDEFVAHAIKLNDVIYAIRGNLTAWKDSLLEKKRGALFLCQEDTFMYWIENIFSAAVLSRIALVMEGGKAGKKEFKRITHVNKIYEILSSHCPRCAAEKWAMIGKKCYRVFRAFYHGFFPCDEEGGTMGRIMSEEENSFVFKLLRRPLRPTVIGKETNDSAYRNYHVANASLAEGHDNCLVMGADRLSPNASKWSVVQCRQDPSNLSRSGIDKFDCLCQRMALEEELEESSTTRDENPDPRRNPQLELEPNNPSPKPMMAEIIWVLLSIGDYFFLWD